jgi:hypothetical protein
VSLDGLPRKGISKCKYVIKQTANTKFYVFIQIELYTDIVLGRLFP